MAVRYRYEFRHILSNEKLDVLPLYGVNMNWNLASAQNTNYGDFTGTFRSDTPKRNLLDMLYATTPGRSCVWVYREDVPIWGGIIWNRTYASQGGGTYQLYAQTHDSFLAKTFFVNDQNWTDDPRNIIRNVWLTTISYGAQWDIHPLLYDAAVADATPITKTLVGGEYPPSDDVVNEMIGLGAEYRHLYNIDANNNPRFLVEFGRWDGVGGAKPIGSPANTYSPEITYPGLIQNYWFAESASSGGVYGYAIGKGTGIGTPRNFLGNAALLADGYPAISKKVNFRETESQTNLDQRLAKSLAPIAIPIISPSFKLRKRQDIRPNSNLEELGFGSIGLGDYVYVILNDPQRFPYPGIFKAYYRAMSMSLKPESSEGPEEFDFTVAQPSTMIGESGA